MIEQGIYFALGCCVAGLLALLFAPVFWQRALRLTRQRLQLQVPLSMQEILAQRDQLRAEFAVERLRVEQALQDVQDAKGRDMAEIGRRTMEIVALTEEIETFRQTVSIQEKALEDARRTKEERGTELATLNALLQENNTKLGEYRRRAESAEADRSRLLSETDSQRTSIASLKTVGMNLEIRQADAERTLAAEREASGALRLRLETAMEHAARHESAGLLMRRELDEARGLRRHVEADLAAAQAAMKAIRAEHEGVVADHASAVQDHAKTAAALRQDLDESRRRAGKALAELDIAQAALAEFRSRDEETGRQRAAAAEQDQANQQLRRDLEEMRRRLDRSDADLAGAQAALREARERADAATQTAGQRADQEAAHATTRRELDEARAETLRLRDEAGVARKADEDAHSALAAAHSQAEAALTAALATARADHATKTAALTARVDDALQRLAAAEEARADAERALAIAQAQTQEAPKEEAPKQETQTREDEKGGPPKRAEEGTPLHRQLADATARASLLQTELGAAQARLEEAIREGQTLGEARDADLAQHSRATVQLRRDLDDARGQIRKLDDKLNQANVLLGEARETIEQHRVAADLASQAELADARRALDEAAEREKAASIQRSLQADKDRRAERRLKGRIEALAAENDALKAGRADAGRGDSETTAPDRDEAGLRESIHALGLAVARLTRDADGDTAGGRRARADEPARPIGVA